MESTISSWGCSAGAGKCRAALWNVLIQGKKRAKAPLAEGPQPSDFQVGARQVLN